MISGFLAPDGTFHSCPSFCHMSLADKLVARLNLRKEKPYEISEDILLKHGYICIRASDVYKAAYGYDRKVLLITDEQQAFFEKHIEEFWDRQLADIDSLLRDFGKMRERRERSTHD